MILYINSCSRKESRTHRLALEVLKKLGNKYEEVKLIDLDIKPLNESMLNQRSRWIEKKDFDHPYFDLAKQFSNADTIVISAPYWDMSFPSVLKEYIENIYITGLVSEYNELGMPVGLCKAKNLYYVVSAGGTYDPRFSYDYIHDMATICFGIENVKCIKAEMLDIVGSDVKKIMDEAIKSIEL